MASLSNWSQYLSHSDYNYLVQYVENIKNSVSNTEMIILLGPERSGKSTLINEITAYLGENICENYCMTPSDIIYRENIKPLYFCCGIPTGKRNLIALTNLIKYGQSFIAATKEFRNTELLEVSRVIAMEHVF